jgi:hypothetical protein
LFLLLAICGRFYGALRWRNIIGIRIGIGIGIGVGIRIGI